MDLWQKARGFAEEAAKRSQEISQQAARKSQELTKGAARFSQEFVTDAAKRSREIAAEASRKAEELRAEALRRADQIKTLAGEIDLPGAISPIAQIGQQGASALLGADGPEGAGAADLERFGVTEELREFVKGITISTFKDFPMEEDTEMSDVALVSNVRQDLNQWQARHATLVLSSVKEISKFRYELCPRYMKERKFWQIYFILVNNYVERYEKKYMEDKLKSEQERQQNEKARENEATVTQSTAEETKLQSKTSTASTAEHDLDVFLLGDLGSSDEGPDIGDDEFDDDFDKIDNAALDSDDEDIPKAAK